MKLELVPMLQMQRELYDLPRGADRFRRYLTTMLGDTDDIAIPPMVAMNPMGKEHVAATYDALLAFDAEMIAATALIAAEQRLLSVPGQFKLGLTVADDLAGGWTNRYAAEMGRFDAAALIKRGWIGVVFWTADQPAVERVRETVLAAVFRTAYLRRYGAPRTLRAMLIQETHVAAFAGITQPALDLDELAYTRGVIAPLLDATDYPTQFAALWGDEAAAMFGYGALGLPPWAGLALAIAQARRLPYAPEDHLIEDHLAPAPVVLQA